FGVKYGTNMADKIRKIFIFAFFGPIWRSTSDPADRRSAPYNCGTPGGLLCIRLIRPMQPSFLCFFGFLTLVGASEHQPSYLKMSIICIPPQWLIQVTQRDLWRLEGPSGGGGWWERWILLRIPNPSGHIFTCPHTPFLLNVETRMDLRPHAEPQYTGFLSWPTQLGIKLFQPTNLLCVSSILFNHFIYFPLPPFLIMNFGNKFYMGTLEQSHYFLFLFSCVEFKVLSINHLFLIVYCFLLITKHLCFYLACLQFFSCCLLVVAILFHVFYCQGCCYFSVCIHLILKILSVLSDVSHDLIMFADAIASFIQKNFHRGRSVLKSQLKQLKSTISPTCDVWTSPRNNSILRVTAHWTYKYQLKSTVHVAKLLNGNHTGKI
ncbi:uncharacterized protein VP01_3855g1, partial [Puccinia sorghi]